MSLENGREVLNAIRIKVHGTTRSLLVLRDYLDVMTKVPDLNLFVSVSGKSEPVVKSELNRISPQVKSRIFIEKIRADDSGIWAQDKSKPVSTPDLTTLSFQPSAALDAFESAGKIRVINLPFELQGGNIIVGDRHIFVGPSEVQTVMQKLFVSQSQALAVLEKLFSKKILVIGVPRERSLEQKSFHIDLDLVVAVDRRTNEEVVLVASPLLLLRELANQNSLPNRVDFHTIRFLEKKIYERAQQTLQKGQLLSPGFLALLRHSTIYRPYTILQDEYYSRYIQKWLQAHGYRTQEIPGYGSLSTYSAGYFFATNAILSGSHSFVPGNLFSEIDQIGKSVFENLGYQVHLMPSSANTIELLGGIRCASETYRRCSY